MPKVPYCGRSMFYQEAGEGPVLIFLHGNTASSRLFEPLLPLYTPHFRCVLLDFLGNGRSDRVESFPADQRGGTDGGGVHPRALPPHPVRRDLPAGRGGGPGPDPGGGL